MNEHKPQFPYEDIIDLPRPVSENRAKMSNADRAAQFSPFAALSGYEEAINETARLTQQRIELTEGEKMLLNETLQEILERIHTQPRISVTYFQPDLRKEGGEYVTETCHIRKVDAYGRGILRTDGKMIPFEDIIALEEL